MTTANIFSSLPNCSFLVTALTRTAKKAQESPDFERRLLLNVVNVELGRTAVLDLWMGQRTAGHSCRPTGALCGRKWNGAVPSNSQQGVAAVSGGRGVRVELKRIPHKTPVERGDGTSRCQRLYYPQKMCRVWCEHTASGVLGSTLTTTMSRFAVCVGMTGSAAEA